MTNRTPPARTPPVPLPPPRGGDALPRSALLVVVLAALGARAAGLGNGFVNYDDPQLREEVARLSPLDMLTGPFYFAYKPVYGLWLWLERALFGDVATPGLVASWLLFAAAAGLAAVVLHGLLRNAWLAAGAALLLAVHPAHAENVAWWAERKDALSLVLVLLAHRAHQRARAHEASDGRPRVPLAPAAFLLLGGLTKGTAWAWAAVLALDEVVAPDARPGRLRRLSPVFVVAALGVALDAWTSAKWGPGAVRYDATLAERAAAMAGVHLRYALTLLWPFSLSADYPVDPRGSWLDLPAALGAALLLAVVVGLVVGIARRRRVLAVACGLWLAGLAPVNNLWPATSILQSDRYLLMPALGLYVGASAALLRARHARVAATLVLAVLLGTLALARGPVWRDSETLWTDTLAKRPSSAIAAINRAADRMERQDVHGAVSDARRGVEAAAALSRPELMLRGRLLLSTALAARAASLGADGLPVAQQAVEEALLAVEQGQAVVRSPWLAEDPKVVASLSSSAVATAFETRARLATDVRSASEDFGRAIDAWRAAARDDPRSWAAWRNLGNLLAAVGGESRLDEAIDALARAVDLRPHDVGTVVQLVTALTKRGRDAEARAVFDAASARIGATRPLRRVRAHLQASVGDPEAGDRALDELHQEDPSDAETRSLLLALRRRRAEEALAAARLSNDRADLERARSLYERALELGREDREVHLGLADTLLLLGRYRDARLRYGKARVAAAGAAWIKNLEARAAVLEAVAHEHAGRPDEAARALAEAIEQGPPRLDLGFVVLEQEALRAREAAAAVLATDDVDRPAAVALLRGMALLVGGDELAALRRLNEAVLAAGARVAPGSKAARIAALARLLRATVRGRHADVVGARVELEALLQAAPDDPLVAFHALLLDRTEATARVRIADAGEDPDGLARAQDALASVGTRARALAERGDVPWPGPALLAAELDLERGEGAAVLSRLNVAAQRFPDAASVRRGKAFVYQRMMLLGGDRTMLLREAQRELTEARRVDPRDPRTALDYSQLYRLAGDLEQATKHAISAASVEPVRGPARRALAAILVEQGRKALERNDTGEAMRRAVEARRADPEAAGPDQLVGDVAMGKGDLAEALKAYEAAARKAPADDAVREALAACHRQRGAAFFLARQLRPKPGPGPDGAPPDPKKVAAWEAWFLPNLRGAMREYESALALEPDGPQAAEDERRLETLRSMDPEAKERSVAAARAAFEAGEAARRDDRLEDALLRYRDAADAYPPFFPAWLRIAEMAVRLGSEHDLVGMAAVDRLRALDRDRAYPEVDLYAAEFAVRIHAEARLDPRRRDVEAAAAGQARAALSRYEAAVATLSDAGEREAVGLQRAAQLRARLDAPPGPLVPGAPPVPGAAEPHGSPDGRPGGDGDRAPNDEAGRR